MTSIRVEYAADDEVANADRLVSYVQREIERHLKSIHEVSVSDWDLGVRILKCQMRANHGLVTVELSGSINESPIGRTITVGDKPNWEAFTAKGYLNRRTKTAVANLFAFVSRLVWPSELVIALGSRRICGRLVRAWSDCFREIRIHIDGAVHRPKSGFDVQWRATWISAALLGVLACGICAAAFLVRRDRVADAFRAQLACVWIGIGVYGVIASCGLMLLSDRFFQSERAGLRLVRLIGVKGLAGIRGVAVGLFLLSAVFFVAPGNIT
jgi:hypothetical protein